MTMANHSINLKKVHKVGSVHFCAKTHRFFKFQMACMQSVKGYFCKVSKESWMRRIIHSEENFS